MTASASARVVRLLGLQPNCGILSNLASRTYASGATAQSAVHVGVPAQPEASTSSSSVFLPGWLKNLLRGGDEQNVQDPYRKPDTAATTTASSSSEDLKQLKQLKDMDMDGYVEYCKKMRATTNLPRPRLSSPALKAHERSRMQDMTRYSYLRLLQHEKIGSQMTPNEKVRLKAEGKDLLNNKQFLEQIAARTGVYMELEVKDCIRECLAAQRRSAHLYRYVTVLGNPIPPNHMTNQIVKEMERQEEEEKLQQQAELRDVGNCPMRPLVSWAGTQVTCSRTGLKYSDCCGHKDPLPYHKMYKPRKQLRYRSRSEKTMQKAYDLANKPMFQE